MLHHGHKWQLNSHSCFSWRSLLAEFTWRRVVVRSLLMLAVLFVSETVPHFGKVLPLAGSLLVGLTTFIMPCLFYYRLCSDVRPEWPDRFVSYASSAPFLFSRILCHT